MILEAGLGAAGTDEFFGFIDQVAESSRVCTYDRAGTGVSDDRPEGEHVTAGLMADELHRLLEVLGEDEPVVLVGHSYGGMPVRAFEGTYPDDVAGMVLIDVSSEPEVPVYERLRRPVPGSTGRTRSTSTRRLTSSTLRATSATSRWSW